MKTKRIIPCLDIKDGKTVKGVNFVGLKNIGDPVEMAENYASQGADELVMLDISATIEGRKTFASLVREVAGKIDIPIAVGGGITSVEDAAVIFDAGADKVSVNSAAVKNPELITALASRFGSRSIVAAIDAKKIGNQWLITTFGGNNVIDKDLYSWAKEVESLGAGEILFTSMDHDGMRGGYPCDVYRELSRIVNIPIIASGGAGCIDDVIRVLSDAPDGGCADAALAASVFHYGIITIPELKNTLNSIL